MKNRMKNRQSYYKKMKLLDSILFKTNNNWHNSKNKFYNWRMRLITNRPIMHKKVRNIKKHWNKWKKRIIK